MTQAEVGPHEPWRLERSVRSQLDVAVAVHLTRTHLEQLGVPAVSTARIAIAVSELATNTVRYAGQGTVQVSWRRQGGKEDRTEVCVQVRDNGPGISDLASALRERHSTGGSLGLGLPAVRRMASDLSIQASPVGGTQVTARFWLSS